MTPLLRALSASVVIAGSLFTLGAVAADPTPVGSVAEMLRRLDERDRKIEERDAVIRDLERRVEQLERQMAAPAAPAISAEQPAPQVASDTPKPSSKPPARSKSSDASASPTPEKAATATDGAAGGAAPPPAPQQPAKQAAASTGLAPGQFEVDPDAAERALERTLVEAGVVLLPVGKVEVQPSFTYTRRDESSQLLVALTTGEVVTGGEQRVKRNEFMPATTIRVGLPFDSQFNLNVPYNIVEQSVSQTVGATRNVANGWGKGIGDVSVGLATTLLRERGWIPDLVAGVTWDSATGQRVKNDVPLGSGFNELGGALIASKRLDPLAFIASASYQKAFESNNIRPGDEIGFGLGAVLAASPETSLFVNLNQSFINDVKANGHVVNGTNQVQATVSTGISVILGRGVLLTLSGGAGLTDDSPDYFVGISLPIRFDLPIR